MVVGILITPEASKRGDGVDVVEPEADDDPLFVVAVKEEALLVLLLLTRRCRRLFDEEPEK